MTDLREERWALEEELEQKSHFLCKRNGFVRPVPSEYTDSTKFIEDYKVYTERYRYYYGQLSTGKMQVL